MRGGCKGRFDCSHWFVSHDAFWNTEKQFELLILIQRSRNTNTTTAWTLKTLISLTEREIITNNYFQKHQMVFPKKPQFRE